MARNTTAWLDKSGKSIFRSEWEKRHEDEDYWLLAKFESKRGHIVTAEFNGVIKSAHRIPRSKWAPYALEVHMRRTKDINGEPLEEPVITRDELACERFVTLEQLEKAFNDFVSRYCDHKGDKIKLKPGKDDPEPEPEPEPLVAGEDDDDDDYPSEHPSAIDDSPLVEEKVPPADPSADKPSGFGGDW